jgi:hypothetical protein
MIEVWRECDGAYIDLRELQPELEVEWDCPNCKSPQVDNYLETAVPFCGNCLEDVHWDEILTGKEMEDLNRASEKAEQLDRELVRQRCPICNELLTPIIPGSVKETELQRHRIGTAGAPFWLGEIAQNVEYENDCTLAAHRIDADAYVNLGLYGEMWIQCPKARKRISHIFNMR